MGSPVPRDLAPLRAGKMSRPLALQQRRFRNTDICTAPPAFQKFPTQKRYFKSYPVFMPRTRQSQIPVPPPPPHSLGTHLPALPAPFRCSHEAAGLLSGCPAECTNPSKRADLTPLSTQRRPQPQADQELALSSVWASPLHQRSLRPGCLARPCITACHTISHSKRLRPSHAVSYLDAALGL